MKVSSPASSGKRIAKNTTYLYIRTAIILIISLYSSRLLLLSLGETDLGVFNLVGGIVAMLSFFESAQAKATSRFITYDLGTSEVSKRLSRTFAVCISIHLIISLIVFVVGETLGGWIINHWISIPTERHYAASFVYHCVLITFCLHVLRIPFSSVIIAHEEMSVFAYISIIEALLQLASVYVLLFYSGDSLLLYGVLIFLVSVVVFLLNWGYVKIKHPSCTFRFIWDKEYSVRILTFSGWSMVGSTANTATHQGLSLLLNNFVGIIANTALGFATQVNGAVSKFVGSFSTAFNPQIIKLYAQNNLLSLNLLISRASKISFLLAYILSLPLIANMEYILSIWLNHVPCYTVGFCQLILVCCTIDATTGSYNTAITATGEIKWYQICISCSFISDLLLSYILLLLEFNPMFVFGSRILTRGLLNMLIGLFFIKRKLSFEITTYMKRVLFPISITILTTSALEYGIIHFYDGLTALIASVMISLLANGACAWIFLFTKQERAIVSEYVYVIIKKIRV